MHIIEKKLQKMTQFNLVQVCYKMKIKCNKKEKKSKIISKLLVPFMKYKMYDNPQRNLLRRSNTLPDGIRRLLLANYPNFESEQVLDRFGDLSEDLQRIILDNYSGLRDTSATKIQTAFKIYVSNRYIRPLFVEYINEGLDSPGNPLYNNYELLPLWGDQAILEDERNEFCDLIEERGQYINFEGLDLNNADLRDMDLRRAINLEQAILTDAKYDDPNLFPAGFNFNQKGMTLVE